MITETPNAEDRTSVSTVQLQPLLCVIKLLPEESNYSQDSVACCLCRRRLENQYQITGNLSSANFDPENRQSGAED